MLLNSHLAYITFKIRGNFSSTCDMRNHYYYPITRAKRMISTFPIAVGGRGYLVIQADLEARILTLGLVFDP